MVDFENKIEKILCKTNEEGLELLSFLEEYTPCKWVSNNKPTDIKLFSGSCNHHNAPLTITINDNKLTWAYEGEKYEISFNKFKEKYMEEKEKDLRTLLQPGLIVKTKDNSHYIILKMEDSIVLCGKNTWVGITNFNKKLNNTLCSDNDIMEIYQTKLGFPVGYYLCNDIVNKITIWKRQEQVELTMDEIADKFGINVEQLKIKK